MNLQQLKDAGFIQKAFIVVCIITMFAFGNYLLSPSDPASKSPPDYRAGASAPPASQVAVRENPHCNNTWEDFQVGPNPKTFNKGGACEWRMQHPQGCIMVRRAAWTGDKKDYGPYCDGGPSTLVKTPLQVEKVWSSNSHTFDAVVRLIPTTSSTPTHTARNSVGVEAKVGVGVYRN